MQRYNRPQCPTQLTAQVKADLTQEYQTNKTSVWSKSYIKDALFEMADGKCIYCECTIGEESKYLEVEHFEDKNHYPLKVVEWSNLLPSCKRCNGKKSNHDVIADPIVNPSIEEPKDHLDLKNYRFSEKTTKGKSTIDVISLNDTDKLVMPRFKIGNKALESLESLTDDIRSFTPNPQNVRARNKLVNRMTALMNQGIKTEEFCSTVATVLVLDNGLSTMRTAASDKSIWDDELETIYNQVIALAY
jgi:5-methylcytosine-specific restriction endonuclease McrA